MKCSQTCLNIPNLVRICEKRLLERIFGPKKEAGKNCITRVLIFSAINTKTVRVIRERRMRLDVGVGNLYHAKGEIRNAYKISINCKRKCQYGTHRHI